MRGKQRVAWMLVTSGIWLVATGTAGEGPPPPPVPQDGLPVQRAEMHRAAAQRAAEVNQQLRRLRESRQAAVAEPPAPTASVPVDSSSEQRRLIQLRRDLDDRQADWDQRRDRLNAQLSRLEELVQDAPWCQDAEEQSRPPTTTTVPVASSHAAETLGPATPTLVRPGPVVVESAAPTPAPQEIPAALVDAIAVTDQPVDRMGLANNLYATGEYHLALQIYERVDAESLSLGDREWVLYQIANCHRKLGHKADAERGFRMVTAGRQEGWCSQDARWWLDTNDRLSGLQQRVQQLQQTLKTLEENTRVDAKSL